MDICYILVRTDFSDYAKKPISDAFVLAQTFGAKLSLLHVVSSSSRHTPSRNSPRRLWAQTC